MATPSSRSILVIGATGRTGQAVLQAGLAYSPQPFVHAFARTPSKLPPELASRCTSVISGDGSDSEVVARALEQTAATDVVLCTGVPGGLSTTTVRTDTGRALAVAIVARREQLRSNSGTNPDSNSDADEGAPKTTARTRVVVVSALGAGGSTIHVGWGFGAVVSWIIAQPLRDHDEQERVLEEAFQACQHELLIARPTGLTDGAPAGGVCVHDGQDKVKPTVTRTDMAEWIVDQICGVGDWFGKAAAICAN